MKPTQTVALAAILALGACGGPSSARLNPFHWFGGNRAQQEGQPLAPKGGYPSDNDHRRLVEKLTALKVDPMPGGVIIHATGLPPTQGWWDAALVPTNDGNPDDKGTMTYRFVITPPMVSHRVSTPQSREVTAGAYLTDVQLASIRRIEVQGQTNSLSTRRR